MTEEELRDSIYRRLKSSHQLPADSTTAYFMELIRKYIGDEGDGYFCNMHED